jgi:YD repeat-containing protein
MARYGGEPLASITTHARVTQWMAQGATSGPYTASAVPDWIKAPLESTTSFTYANQTNGFHGYHVLNPGSGNMNKPISISRVLDNGSTQTYSFTYNLLGNVTQEIDPVGRKFSYTYASNGIDLLEKRQIRGNDNDLNGQWVYNSAHLPLVQVDASGQRSEFAYNARGQTTSNTDANGNSVALTYDTNGYLTQINGPLAGNVDVTSFSYDGFGRVYTVTDSEGYVLTFSYDAMNRPTQVTYPDGTNEQTAYSRLDAVLLKDRNGRWTQRSFDSMDQLVAETLCVYDG